MEACWKQCTQGVPLHQPTSGKSCCKHLCQGHGIVLSLQAPVSTAGALQVPLSAIERRRKARLEYNRLYTRTHCRLPNYKDPDRFADLLAASAHIASSVCLLSQQLIACVLSLQAASGILHMTGSFLMSLIATSQCLGLASVNQGCMTSASRW